MTTKKSFEDAYTKRYPVTVQFMPNKFDVNELGEYEDPAVIVGWSMWQAATAAMLELAPATAPEKTVKEIMEFARHYAAGTFDPATLEDKIRRSLEAPK